MCLIAHVPSGKSLPIINMRAAHFANDDGIGIMSKMGICKFLGKKALKKAIKTVAELENAKIEYAIHFRYKTHGDVILQNCHPFKTPNGAAYVMHNGVLGAYTDKATADCSDTGAFVKEFLTDVPNDNNTDYWSSVARHIGWNNKLCVMTHDFKFILVHGDAGTYRDGVWYSQTYSLPHIPYVGVPHTGTSYNSVPRSQEWPYHLETCVCKTCTERNADTTLSTGEGGPESRRRDTKSWVNRHPNWFDELKARDKAKLGKVPTSIVTDSLRQALDRRYGIHDPRMLNGRRIAQPLRLTHTPNVVETTPLQSLAANIPGVESAETRAGVDDSRETRAAKDEDMQLDAALQRHLARMEDDGHAELEIDVSTRGEALLPGWSELGG